MVCLHADVATEYNLGLRSLVLSANFDGELLKAIVNKLGQLRIFVKVDQMGSLRIFKKALFCHFFVTFLVGLLLLCEFLLERLFHLFNFVFCVLHRLEDVGGRTQAKVSNVDLSTASSCLHQELLELLILRLELSDKLFLRTFIDHCLVNNFLCSIGVP